MNREELKTAIGFDLDSTLCSTRWRWHLSPMADPSSDWHRYCSARLGDEPFPGPVTAARLHYLTHQVHIFSGSTASSEAVTRTWLDKYRVPFDGLRQRGDDDRRPNAEIKIGYILDLRAAGVEMVLYYEDHPDVAAAIYEATRVPVICVNPCYPEDAEKYRTTALDGMGGGL